MAYPDPRRHLYAIPYAGASLLAARGPVQTPARSAARVLDAVRMQRREVERWVAGYERAWRTAGTGALGELFAANASYSPAPFREPWRGLDAIRRSWEKEREGPDETFTLTSEVLAVEGDTAVVRVQVRYAEPRGTYRDLWVIEFDADGRCRSFEEWPFWPPGTSGSIAGE